MLRDDIRAYKLLCSVRHIDGNAIVDELALAAAVKPLLRSNREAHSAPVGQTAYAGTMLEQHQRHPAVDYDRVRRTDIADARQRQLGREQYLVNGKKTDSRSTVSVAFRMLTLFRSAVSDITSRCPFRMRRIAVFDIAVGRRTALGKRRNIRYKQRSERIRHPETKISDKSEADSGNERQLSDTLNKALGAAEVAGT